MAELSGAAGTSNNSRLNAVIAALSKMDSSLQGPALKQYLEYGLERLQAIEQAHYEFLGECAMLAADNMQDIRLQDLEKRTAALENQNKPWGETLADIALNIAMQIAVLATLEAAAALVIAAAGQSALRAAVSSAARSISSTGTKDAPLLSELVRLESDQIEAQKAIDFLLSIKGNLAKGAPQLTYKIKISATETRAIRGKNIEDWINVLEELVTRRENAGDKLRLAQQAAANATKAQRVMSAYDGAIGNASEEEIARYWSKWRDFIGGERGGLLMDPVQTIFEEVQKSLNEASGDSESGGQFFLSSTVTGRFLSWAGNERIRIADEYANLRLYVRYASDTDVKGGSEPIMFLAHLISENLPKWERLRLVAQAARPWVVSGFEAAFWREYLLANDMLDIKYDVKYSTLSPTFGLGHIVDGYMIKKLPQGFNTTLYVADYFYGVTKLTELQTDYLFHRFAKRYFDTAKDAPSLPFEYKPDNYKDVVTKEVWGLVPQNKRIRRINEMRVMVILYFANLNPGETDRRLNSLLKETISIGISDTISGSDIGIAPEPTSAEEENNNIIETANLLQSILALGDSDATKQLQIQQLAFADMVTDLNMDILNYNVLNSNPETIVNPGDKTLEELKREIEDEQLILQSAYEDLKKLAQDNPDALKAIKDVYENTVNNLLNWNADTPGTFPWRWYGPQPLVEE